MMQLISVLSEAFQDIHKIKLPLNIKLTKKTTE